MGTMYNVPVYCTKTSSPNRISNTEDPTVVSSYPVDPIHETSCDRSRVLVIVHHMRMAPLPHIRFWTFSMLLSFVVRAFVAPRSVAFTCTSLLPCARATTTVCSAQPLASPMTTSAMTNAVDTSPAYRALLSKLQTITQLERVKSVLNYDQLVFMPPDASVDRGAQMSALAALIHEKTTDQDLQQVMQAAAEELAAIDSVENDNSHSSIKDAKRLLELELQKLQENQRLSPQLAAKVAELGSAAYTAWVQAKTQNDFANFAPVLKECFETSMEVSRAKKGDKDITLYTQMLDEYEMGMSQTRIDDIFSEVQAALVPLIANVLASNHKPSTDPLHGTFDIDSQKALCEDIVTKMGYDKKSGRIDVSVHPFTTSFSPNDVRITSRYRMDEWYQGMAAMIHESGHAMYEQNLGNSATSIDTALSMGTHESQSLFWERHVGLGLPFWKWATPLLQDKFPDQFAGTSPEDIYGAVNAVSPSLIRVEADELTYPLHVIMRYGIEKDVIGGNLEVQDIPDRWKQDMKSMLDVDVPDDTRGCLQDIHWASLAFGYFPTYLIGSVTAAQLAHYCRKDLPMDELIEKGEFSEIKQWLTAKIHRHGKRYQSLDALLEDEIGERLNPKYFIQYLQDKYTDLYKL